MQLTIKAKNVHITPHPRVAVSPIAELFGVAIAQAGAPAKAAASPGAASATPAAPPAGADARTTPALGELWPGEGGFYGGTMPARNGAPAYHLIVSTQQKDKVSWGPYEHAVEGAGDHWDGQANTKALLASGKEHPAAAWAADTGMGPHEDFYLPSHAEMAQLWINVPEKFAKEGWYWTSTQYSPYGAWAQDFETGDSRIDSKDYEFRAVAVRRLVI